MGYYRCVPMSGATSAGVTNGYYRCWPLTEKFGYLAKIKYSPTVTSLGLSNSTTNSINITDPDHTEYSVWASGSSTAVTGINVSDFDKLYLNADCSSMFSGLSTVTDWSNFDKLDFSYVVNCYNMFCYCRYFNYPVIMPDTVTDCRNMFMNCRSLNQPVVISNSVDSCCNMFMDCHNFNQPVVIPNNVLNCSNMFCNCNNFNSSVTIGSKVTSCANMFQNSNNFKQIITIPASATDLSYMFYKSVGNAVVGQTVADTWIYVNMQVTDIYIKGKTARTINVVGMLARRVFNNSNSKFSVYNRYRTTRVNIYFNPVLQNQFNKTTAATSLMNNSMSWATTTNGYYNAQANIYLFNNYAG